MAMARCDSCPAGFSYTSGANDRWVEPEDMKRMILELNAPGADDLREAWSRHTRPAPTPAKAR